MGKTFQKIFSDFETGIEEVREYLPLEVQYYIGNAITSDDAIEYALDVLKKDLLESSDEDGFWECTFNPGHLYILTEDGIAFQWDTVTKDEFTEYHFAITFHKISKNKKNIIQRLLENDWHDLFEENHPNEEKYIPLSNFSQEEDIDEIAESDQDETIEEQDVQEVYEEPAKPLFMASPLPVFNQEDDYDQEVVQDAEIVESNSIDERQAILDEIINEKIQQREQNRSLVEENSRRVSNLANIEKRMQVVQQTDMIPADKQQKESLKEMVDAQNLVESPKQMILQNGKPAEATRGIREGYVPMKLDPRMYNIAPTDKQSVVLITYEGNQFPVNVNEQNHGIFRDPNSRQLRIKNILYNYGTFQVSALPEDYSPDQALHVGASSDKMNDYGAIPDEVFVPRETIIKNQEPDIYAIQEEAEKRARFEEKLTGIRKPSSWHNYVRQQQDVDSYNTVPRESGQVLRRGKSFVIDKPKILQNEPQRSGMPAAQSVQVINDEGPQYRSGY